MSATKSGGSAAGSISWRNESLGCTVVTTVDADTCAPETRSTPVTRSPDVVIAVTSVPVLICAPKVRAALDRRRRDLVEATAAQHQARPAARRQWRARGLPRRGRARRHAL